MGQVSLTIPQIGLPDTTQDPLIQNDFTALQTVINGGLDGTNLSATTAQSAGVNQSGQVVKGSSIIATSETRTNTAYGLMPTPDQVQNVVLPANGLIAVWYQATWQESVAGAGSAAVFLGANQLARGSGSGGAAAVTAANLSGAGANINEQLTSTASGLQGQANQISGAYTGDVTTGQIVGVSGRGGPMYVFAAAGTYSVSVQFKASSGSVTVSSRRLYVAAVSFT